ncbi:MAG: heparinase II/III family protein [Proteobacteria bacterium]|nr:heparinase II/III family protein [Pseudomonadota bacterium]
MRFSDGSMPRFNDSAEGIAPPYKELSRVAHSLGLEPPFKPMRAIELLASSGYARLAWSDALAFVDVACIGPDYLPGHAHADTLSFELEEDTGQAGCREQGTSCYGDSPRAPLRTKYCSSQHSAGESMGARRKPGAGFVSDGGPIPHNW